MMWWCESHYWYRWGWDACYPIWRRNFQKSSWKTLNIAENVEKSTKESEILEISTECARWEFRCLSAKIQYCWNILKKSFWRKIQHLLSIQVQVVENLRHVVSLHNVNATYICVFHLDHKFRQKNGNFFKAIQIFKKERPNFRHWRPRTSLFRRWWGINMMNSRFKNR